MLDGASSSERRLLRRLMNQEIAHYARYSMKAAEPIRIPGRNVAMPEGFGTLALLLVSRWTPAALRRSGPRMTQIMRARRQRLADRLYGNERLDRNSRQRSIRVSGHSRFIKHSDPAPEFNFPQRK